MLLTTLATILPFILTANSFLFEPPSAKRHAPIRRALAARVPTPAANWVKLGCYVDTITPRSLTAAQTVSDAAMSNAYCQEYCDAHGFAFAGTEWSKECYCGTGIHNALLTTDGECDMTCTGAPEVCGGPARITVWQNQGTVTDPARQTIGDWTGQGCYSDSVEARALPTRKMIDGMTVEKCTTSCFTDGFKYAGLEYGNECYCANTIITSASIGTPADDGCNMPCEGNQNQSCGGGNRLNLYQYTGATVPGSGTTTATQIASTGDWTLKGCYSDSVDARALAVREYVDGGMTVEKCTEKCFSLGYQFSGVEYASECYCSNAIVTTASSGSVAADGCNMPCEGATSTEICGGSDRLTVYEYSGSGLAMAPTVLDSYNDWTSQGCYVDSVNARVLTPMPTALAPMTAGNCIDACAAAGYSFAGVEFSSECYCGNAIPLVAATDGCVMKCDGDVHLCGGPNRLNVYQKIVAPPVILGYRIRVTVAEDGSSLGYIPRALGPFLLHYYGADAASAQLVEIQGPSTVDGPVDIFMIDSVSPANPYLGAYFATQNYVIVTGIKQTPAGSTRQPTGSTRSGSAQGESCIWKVDPVTSQLHQIWVRDDGVAVPYVLVRGAPNLQYIMATVNFAAFLGQFTQAQRLNFFLEPVTSVNPTIT